jgi:hypothetical protein
MPADNDDLSQAGWAVVYADEYAQQEAREALQPLISVRREQASRRDERLFRELVAQRARSGEGFVLRDTRDGREVKIDRLPRYVLLVGSPERLAFNFQQQLAARRDVGRLYFHRPGGYHVYAKTVIEAESRPEPPGRGVLFVRPHDALSSRMNESLCGKSSPVASVVRWQHVPMNAADRKSLVTAVARQASPSIVLMGGHGACFPLDADSNEQQTQQKFQGALVTEWQGPGSALTPADCLTVDDIDDSTWRRRVVIQISSFAAGTSQVDELRTQIIGGRVEQARRSFVSTHVRALLGKGAVGFIGPVDRCWHFALGTGEASDWAARESLAGLVRRILGGERLGIALGEVNAFGTEAAAGLSAELDAVRLGKHRDDERIVSHYATMQAARSLILLGDPAVRAFPKKE